MSWEVRYFRMHGATDQEDTEELVEYVGKYPSRQVRILLHDGTGYTDERRRWYINSAYDQHLLTDRPLDLNPNLPPYDEAGRANLAPITKEEFEAAWIKSFEFLHRMTRSHKGWLISEEETGINPL